jgi:hypothetical protein
MKTRHRFSPFLEVRRELYFPSGIYISQKPSNLNWSGSGVIGATLGVSGRWDAEEVEVEGTKTRAERNEKGSPHPPQQQASSHPL